MAGKSQERRVDQLEQKTGICGSRSVFIRFENVPREQAIEEAVKNGGLSPEDTAVLRGEDNGNERTIAEIVICFVEPTRKFDELGNPIS